VRSRAKCCHIIKHLAQVIHLTATYHRIVVSRPALLTYILTTDRHARFSELPDVNARTIT